MKFERLQQFADNEMKTADYETYKHVPDMSVAALALMDYLRPARTWTATIILFHTFHFYITFYPTFNYSFVQWRYRHLINALQRCSITSSSTICIFFKCITASSRCKGAHALPAHWVKHTRRANLARRVLLSSNWVLFLFTCSASEALNQLEEY